jgi:transglutaminase-like putative cysteine protease
MPSTPRRAALFALAVLLALAPAGRGQDKFYRPELTKEAIDSTIRTDWYGVYLKGQKIGYVRGERKRVGDTIVEEQVMAMKLVSFGMKVEILSTQSMTFESAAPYRLVGASLVQKGGPVEETIKFALTTDGYQAVHQAAGEKREVLLKGIDFTLADASATEMWVRKKPKVGAEVVVQSFDLSEMKIDLQANKVVADKTSLAGGVRTHFYEVESQSKLREIKSLSRYDDQGNTLSATILLFELRMEPEAQAKDTQYSQDLFVMGMVKIDREVGHTKKVSELVVEVDGPEGEVFEDGPRQGVVAADGGKRLIKLGKKYGKRTKATDEEVKEGLAETNAYPISHAKIKALADKVTAGARTDEQKVAKIVAFVHDYVQPSLSANAPNIHDLLENKKGDCKSYALMFNTLARAAGVPAREVSGLLYVGDDFKAFGGHAWNEVVLNGEWVPVDASLGETELDAAHVCFGTEHRATKNLLSTLGKLSFRLVEVKSAE